METVQSESNENPKKNAEYKSSLLDILTNRIFWSIYVTTIVIAGGVIWKFYDFGKDNGHAEHEQEKADCYDENKKLKSDTTNQNRQILNLKKKLSDCNTTIIYLDSMPKQEQEIFDPSNTIVKNPVTKEKITPKKKGKPSDNKINPAEPYKKQPDDRIKKVQAQLDFFEGQNKDLIDENDKLKSEISLMRQKLQRARELGQKWKIETNNETKIMLEDQQNDILIRLENRMQELVPNDSQKTNMKSDTVKIIEFKTVIDYEKLGDDNFNNAKELDEKLRTQPDSYFLGLKKNKTKIDFVNSALSFYETALSNYKRANKLDKIRNTENQINDFKKVFKLK